MPPTTQPNLTALREHYAAGSLPYTVWSEENTAGGGRQVTIARTDGSKEVWTRIQTGIIYTLQE